MELLLGFVRQFFFPSSVAELKFSQIATAVLLSKSFKFTLSFKGLSICGYSTVCVLASNNIYGCCPDGEVCSGPVGGPTTIEETPPPTGTDTDTLAPVPTPTTVNTLVPTTVVNSQPLPTTPTFNSVPGGTQELPTEAPTDNTVPVQPTQTTINGGLVFIAWVSQYADIINFSSLIFDSVKSSSSDECTR